MIDLTALDSQELTWQEWYAVAQHEFRLPGTQCSEDNPDPTIEGFSLCCRRNSHPGPHVDHVVGGIWSDRPDFAV